MSTLLIIIYLLSSITFVLGLKMLSHPRTARKGNLIAATGMTVAIFATIFLYESNGQYLGNYLWIFVALILGTLVGWIAAKKVKMTAMPEMVSLFNGMGGACAGLISISEFMHMQQNDIAHLLAIIIGLIIGFISFAGSIVAWVKLNGSLGNIRYPGQKIINNLLLLVLLALSVYFLYNFENPNAQILFYSIAGLSLLYGLLFVFPIGGADMPVVISLLNSLTGMAAACGGFLYYNWAMLTGGILVGSAGTILTILMCKAMNRSLFNVLFSAMGGSSGSSGTKTEGEVKSMGVSDVAALMRYANQVMIVPGYGLAVAQAQHVCHELEKYLEANDIEVKYAIHPVAGRMPGHMNVLLAEANVNYDKLLEMEQA
ncbi:MAG: NAD(P)(+) transhydrogenase (Re/Si-specific) subunit beta, partial [Chitinophagaceae bacterium]